MALGSEKPFRNMIKRIVPGQFPPVPLTLCAPAHKRFENAIGVMHTLGIARNLGAYDTGGVAVVAGAADPADAIAPQQFHLKGAC